MPITCRIPIVADDEAELIVVITARQLAAFRTVLRTESEQTGTAPLVPDIRVISRLNHR